MPAISDQDMNAVLAEESRVCPLCYSLIFLIGDVSLLFSTEM